MDDVQPKKVAFNCKGWRGIKRQEWSG